MLVIDRRLKTAKHPGERITMFFGCDEVTLVFSERSGGRVKVGIEAPEHVRIARTEILERERGAT